MRYVCYIFKLALLFLCVLLTSCLPRSLNENSDSVPSTNRELAARSSGLPLSTPIAFDSQGCRSDAVQKRAEFFEKAIVLIGSVTPHRTLPTKEYDSPIALEPAVALDLLNPNSGLRDIILSFPKGVYQSANLKLLAAEIVLRGQPSNVYGLSIKNSSIQLKFLAPANRGEEREEEWGFSACLDGLKMFHGYPKFDPPQIQIAIHPISPE